MTFPLKKMVRFTASILIVFHLCAIVIAPASIPPTPSSITELFYFFRPYLQVAYLNHGYHYFAPDPGSSSLLEYTVLDSSNRQWGRLPDRQKHWPRLLYHRYFMLTEFFGSINPSNEELRNSVAGAYAIQIAKDQDAEDSWITLDHVTHDPSTREQILVGGRLTDPHRYRHTPLGRYRSVSETSSGMSGAGVAVVVEDRLGSPNSNSIGPAADLGPEG